MTRIITWISVNINHCCVDGEYAEERKKIRVGLV
jgi:hypothetical protein